MFKKASCIILSIILAGCVLFACAPIKPITEATPAPTIDITSEATENPAAAPTEVPTSEPTVGPTKVPETEEPATASERAATPAPTTAPTAKPTSIPTAKPSPEPTPAPTAEPTKAPTPTPAPKYYLGYYSYSSGVVLDSTEYASVSAARAQLDKSFDGKAYTRAMCGYMVYNAKKEVVYAPSSEKISKVLSCAREIVNSLRANKFGWGDTRYNPAVNSSEKLVSCDRFVGWALYNAGFTDQPSDYGLQLPGYTEPGYSYHGHSILTWMENHGFKKITKVSDLQAGDIVLLQNHNSKKIPDHMFIYVSPHFRYDGGDDRRWKENIRTCTNPYSQDVDTSRFLYAYRITD